MPISVFSDFDGTIVKKDIGDELFKEYSVYEPYHSLLYDGKLTIYQYWHIVCRKINSNISFSDIREFALSAEIDSYFVRFVGYCKDNGLPLSIVSDGFDAYIFPILEKLGLADLPVFCNKLLINRNGVYEPEFPFASESCECMCASCKRNSVLSSVGNDEIIIYIGDGISDVCVAEHSDIIFAKKKLAAYCNEKRIPHYPFSTFFDVLRIMQKLLAERNRIKHRHQAQLLRKKSYEME